MATVNAGTASPAVSTCYGLTRLSPSIPAKARNNFLYPGKSRGGSIVKYETALQTDQFLLVAHGTAAEVAKAKDIIETTHPAYCTLHAPETVAA